MPYNPGFVIYNDKPALDRITLYILQQMQNSLTRVGFTYIDEQGKTSGMEFDTINEAINILKTQRIQITEVYLSTEYNTIQYQQLDSTDKTIDIEFWDYDDEVYVNHLDTPELKAASKRDCALLLQAFVLAQSCFFAFMSSHDSKWAGTPDSDEDEYYIASKIQHSFDQKNYQLFESLFSEIAFYTFYLLVLSNQYPNYSGLIEQLSKKYALLSNESQVTIFENKEWKPIWLRD